MKRLSFLSLLALAAFACAVSLNSCKKETAEMTPQIIEEDVPVADRAAFSYGVTRYDGVNPCRITQIDNATGAVSPAAPTAFYVDNAGNTINLDNLKGICLTSWGQYFLTTGNPANPTLGATSPYNNALFKVNPLTGQCSYASTSPFGAVSDLEHSPLNTLKFYGLRDNSNSLVEIEDLANNYGTYNGPFPITGIAFGYTLKGLSLVRDFNGIYLVGCATSANILEPAKLYEIPFTGGAATFITDLTPVADMGAGHCAIGFDRQHGRMAVNRTSPSSTFIIGLNEFHWSPPFAPVTATSFWSALGIDHEDLTSSVY